MVDPKKTEGLIQYDKVLFSWIKLLKSLGSFQAKTFYSEHFQRGLPWFDLYDSCKKWAKEKNNDQRKKNLSSFIHQMKII